MTTLILGGTGFIGRRAVPRLAARGERVFVMDINPNAANFDEFGDLVTVMRGDIMDFEDVVKAILASRPDRIMNLAYLLGSGDDTPHFTMKLNVLGMDNCFEAARVCGVNRVTYASSVAVSGQQSAFGDRHGQRGRRDARHQPVRHAQAVQRVPGPAVQQRLRHEHHRHPSRQRHRPGQGARLHRPRAVCDPASGVRANR